MNANNSEILDAEINEKITIIEQEIEWIQFHENSLKEAIEILHDKNTDALDMQYAKNVINEFNKSLEIIEEHTTQLKSIPSASDYQDMLANYSAFISKHREIINEC